VAQDQRVPHGGIKSPVCKEREGGDPCGDSDSYVKKVVLFRGKGGVGVKKKSKLLEPGGETLVMFGKAIGVADVSEKITVEQIKLFITKKLNLQGAYSR